MVLRRDWIAGLTIAAVFAVISSIVFPPGEAAFGVISSAVGVLMLFVALIRFGLVAAAANMVTGMHVLMLDPSAWYSTPSLLSLVTATAIAVDAFAGYTRSRDALPGPPARL